MRTSLFAAAFCLAAAAQAYVAPVFTARCKMSNPAMFALVKDGARGGGVDFKGDKLGGSWTALTYAFTPEGDGVVCLIFGPGCDGSEGIPFYYKDIKVNGVPLALGSGWELGMSKNGKAGVVAGDGLKLYHYYGARRDIPVNKGEQVVVSMRAKSGSVLEAYADQLGVVAANLDAAMKADSAYRSDALAVCLNELLALSEAKLHVAVPPSGEGSLRDKALALVNAFRAESALCLYDQPKVRAELRDKITQATALSGKLKTECLLAFMFDEP